MAKGLFEVTTSWYEAALPLAERRRRGHFSTPAPLVERILDACGYTSDRDLSAIRVLDPACGSGNFLVCAAQRLLAAGHNAGNAPGKLAALVQHNLWGLDPDPVACFLSETRLQHVTRPFIAATRPPRLHIHQSDALALPWKPCVDLFLANPPYLAAKNTDLSGYQFTHRRGQSDSYLLFLHLGMRVVRPGGWLGLVLPDPLLARANAARERISLLNDFTIHHLWHLDGVFAAQVGAVVIIAQKYPPASTHQVTWTRDKWRGGSRFIAPIITDDSRSSSANHRPPTEIAANCRAPAVPQSLFLSQPRAELRYLLNSERGALIERLRRALDETGGTAQRRLAPLGEFVNISRGEELGREAGAIYRTNAQPASEGHQERHPVLLGGVDIRPYHTPIASAWICREHIKKPLERYLAPRLLVVKSTDRLQAALDVQGQVALQTLYLLHLKTPVGDMDDLYYFLALLNSRLLRDYVYMLHTAYKWVQPQIEQHVLAALPVPLASPEEKRAIVERAQQLVRACSEAGAVVEWNDTQQHLYEEQERAIGALYNST